MNFDKNIRDWSWGHTDKFARRRKRKSGYKNRMEIVIMTLWSMYQILNV